MKKYILLLVCGFAGFGYLYSIGFFTTEKVDFAAVQRDLVVKKDQVDLESLYILVAEKYTGNDNPCNIAAVGEYADNALRGLTAKDIQSSLEDVNDGSLDLERAAYDLSLGSTVLNIKTNTLRTYDSNHKPGDINFIVKDCNF